MAMMTAAAKWRLLREHEFVYVPTYESIRLKSYACGKKY
jgi:hypothetical protein